jgi:hypothetical protein
MGYATAACPIKMQVAEKGNKYMLTVGDVCLDDRDVYLDDTDACLDYTDVCLGTDLGNISIMNRNGIYTIVNKAHEGDITSIKIIKLQNSLS